MIGQCYSLDNKKYNVIILAGGAGSRMGNQSEYIPKALTKLGSRRAIDYIIDRYINVANKFIVGTGYHADLLQSYINGNYPKLDILYSYENPGELKNNAYSFSYCLDLADSRFSTIVLFCDLIPLGNFSIKEDSFLVASSETKGRIGTFRHTLQDNKIEEMDAPVDISQGYEGVMGNFVFSNTPLLKAITYTNYNENKLNDLTNDVVMPYMTLNTMRGIPCEKAMEFGNETDLQEVRKLWEEC